LLVLEKNDVVLKGWTETILENLITRISNGTTEKQSKDKTNYPVSRIETISNEFIDLNKVRYLKKPSKNIIDNYRLEQGDILFSNINSDTHLGKTAIFYDNKLLIHGMNLLMIRSDKRIIIAKFLNYYFKHYRNLGRFISIAQHAVNQSSINQTKLKNIEFYLPPLNEQKRIVSKIENIFSIINSNIETLEILKNQIQNLKKSLLNNALIGKLTEKWRLHNPDLKSSIEIIDDLKKIKHEYTEIPENEVKKLPKIPGEWAWTYLSNLGELSRGKSKHRPRNDPKLFGGKYPFIQTGIVRISNQKITEYVQTYNEVGLAQSRLFPEGTLCITIAANIAETAMLTFPSCFPDSIVGFIGFENLVNTWFVMYYIKSNQEKIQSIAPATAQKNINLDILQKVAVPIMSFDEQNKIVNELELGFSMADNFNSLLKNQIKIHKNLKNSVLKQAFEGKLVPQDPNDEPASELLVKINTKKIK